MLESISERLMQPGMPHHDCPDKVLCHQLVMLLLIDIRSSALFPFCTSV